MKHKYLWLAVRCLLAIYLSWLLPGTFSAVDAGSPPLPFWMILLCFIFTTLDTAFNYRSLLKREQKKGKVRNWSRPSWLTNPFSGAPHLVHMGANALVISGLVGLLQAALAGKLASMNFFPLACGWGILLGSTLFYKLIYEKMRVVE